MDGIINVYKERGYTSHDVVARLRGILHQKKIGHTGTLDPEAEGVLPVCIGRATKVCDFLTDWDKQYRAAFLLGITTDTQDMTGTILGTYPVFLDEAHSASPSETAPETDVLPGDHHLSEDMIRCCIESFIGEIEQIPPMYSARKINGKKLYELARQGVVVERSPRKIRIHEIRIEDIHGKTISIADEPGTEIPVIEILMNVTCSKGTYIRTLCNDIGEKLGCGGSMSSLLRTEVGFFQLSDSRRLCEIEKMRDENRLEECIHPVDSVFADLDAVLLTAEAERLVRNGNPLSCGMMSGCSRFDCDDRKTPDHDETRKNQLRIYGQNREFLAIYEYSAEKQSWRARKMFLEGIV